jgi:CheY-like chemotaxis protein
MTTVLVVDDEPIVGAMWAENRSSGGARVAFTLPR